jgi:biopolymer transport protein ExbB/TolQ
MLTKKLLSLALISTEWIMVLLVVLSIISLAVIIERWLVLRSRTRELDKLKRRIAVALKNSDYASAEDILHNDPSCAANVAYTVIQNMKTFNMEFEDCLSVALSEEKLDLEKRTLILATLGANAPFIGLFGTVLGIINAFNALALNLKSGPEAVMAGISEALVATALGLFVAIPTIVAYNYFSRRIRAIMVGAENFTRVVVARYHPKVKGH